MASRRFTTEGTTVLRSILTAPLLARVLTTCILDRDAEVAFLVSALGLAASAVAWRLGFDMTAGLACDLACLS